MDPLCLMTGDQHPTLWYPDSVEDVMKLVGSVEVREVRFPALVGNRLDDPETRSIPVYLPPGYSPNHRYPVTYYLPGYTGTSVSPLNTSGFEPNLFERLDRMITAGDVPPMLLVIADPFTRLGGSQYLNSDLNGRYEDAVVFDLVHYVDTNFSTIEAPESRAIIGKSSGGYGALILGMRHPDRFGLVLSHSGDLYFEYCYLGDFPKVAQIIGDKGGPAGFVEWFWSLDKKPGNAISALNVIAMAAAYSPNPDAPGSVDLPFDPTTGELIEPIWRRWLSFDPIRLPDRYQQNLRDLKLLWFDCGLRDEYNLHWGARILASRLKTLGIPFTHEEFDDGHMSVGYRVERSFRAVGDVIRKT